MPGFSDPLLLAAPTSFHQGQASAGRDIHFAFRSGSNLRYMKSTNEGTTFSSAVTIDTGCTEVALQQAVAVTPDGTNVYVLYEKSDDLYVIRSEDGGTTWETPLAISTTGSGIFFRVEIIATDAGLVHVVFCKENLNDDLFYCRSTDFGASFSAPTAIFTSSVSPSRPGLAISGDYLHVVWQDERNGVGPEGGGDVFYGRSTDAGLNWGGETQISDTLDTLRADIQANEETAVIVWQYPINAEDLYRKFSDTYGNEWSDEVVINNDSGLQDHPYLAQIGRDVFMVYAQLDSPVRVKYQKSHDSGDTWDSATEIGSVGSGGNQNGPRCIASVNFFHAFIADATSGNVYTLKMAHRSDPVVATIDDFERADEGPPPTGWSNNLITAGGAGQGLEVATGALVRGDATSTYRQGAYRTADVGDGLVARFKVAAVVTANGAGFNLGVCVQNPGATVSGYFQNCFRVSSTQHTWEFWRIDAGVTETLFTISSGVILAVNDEIIVENVSGDLFVWHYVNATSTWRVIYNTYDTTYPGGTGNKVGMEILASTGQVFRVSEFGAGGGSVAIPENITVPIVTGTAFVGNTLSGTNGTWTEDPTSYSYQWQRGDGVTFNDIVGATSFSYILTGADAGFIFRIGVQATNDAGTSGVVYSSNTSAITSAGNSVRFPHLIRPR